MFLSNPVFILMTGFMFRLLITNYGLDGKLNLNIKDNWVKLKLCKQIFTCLQEKPFKVSRGTTRAHKLHRTERQRLQPQQSMFNDINSRKTNK